MTNSSKNSIRFEQEGPALRPYVTVGEYEFKMTHMIGEDDIVKFMKNVGALT